MTQVNATGKDILGLQNAFMLNAAAQQLTKNPDLRMNFEYKALPLTEDVQKFVTLGISSGTGFMFSIAISLITASIISGIINERETNVKQQQMVSGASKVAYWISNYIIDLLKLALPTLTGIVCVPIFNLDLPQSWLLFVMNWFAILPFTYASSFVFKKESTARNFTRFLHIVLGTSALLY